MNEVQITAARLNLDPKMLGMGAISKPSMGFSIDPDEISAAIMRGWERDPGVRQRRLFVPSAPKSLAEKLYDSLAEFKVHTASVAMHLDRRWRDRLFGQLDGLLDSENWESEDLPPTLASFATFLRMILALKPARRPGLAATSDGILIASWTNADCRLSVECLPRDRIRYVLSRPQQGEIEYAAGITDLVRLQAVLQPYDPAVLFGQN